MENEERLIANKRLKFVKNSAHEVIYKNGVNYITRKELPRFTGKISTNFSGFVIDEIEWIDSRPSGSEESPKKYLSMALAFLISYYTEIKPSKVNFR